MKRLLMNLTLIGAILTSAGSTASANEPGKPLILASEGKAVARMILNSAGDKLAAINSDGEVRVWTVPEGRLVASFPSRGAPGALAFSADGKYLAVGAPQKVQIWNVVTRMPDSSIPHGGTLPNSALAFSRDGKRLILSSATITLGAWVDTRTPLEVSQDNIDEVGNFYFDGYNQNVGRNRGKGYFPKSRADQLQYWDLEQNEKLDAVPLKSEPSGFDFTESGHEIRMCASGSLSLLLMKKNFEARALGEVKGRLASESGGSGIMVVVDEPRKVAGWALDRFGKPSEVFNFDARGNLHRVVHAAASGDGSRIATAHESTDPKAVSILKIWDRTGAEPDLRHEIRVPHRTPMTALVISPDGRAVVTAATDGSVKLWPISK